MKILIFGCAGYIGSEVTLYLLSAGHEIIGVDALVYQQTCVVQRLSHPKFNFYQGNLGDHALLSTLPEVDVVINLAGYVGDQALKLWPNEAHNTNVTQTKANIDFYKNSRAEYIFASSCSVYGHSTVPATETSVTLPLTEYASQKIEIEEYLAQTIPNSKIFRLATVFGPSLRTRVDLLVNQLVYNAVTDTATVLYRPDDWRPYLYIKDIGPLVGQLIGTSAQLVNLGCDQNNVTKRQLVEMIDAIVPKASYQLQHVEDGPDCRDYRVSFELLSAITSAPRTLLEDGISELYQVLARKDCYVDCN